MRMRDYLIKRLLTLVPILLIVASITFFLMKITPGDPAALMLGPEAMPADIQKLREELGITAPITTQFVRWIGRAMVGDLGSSYYYGKPVIRVVVDRIEPTFWLTAYALIIAVIIGIPSGVIAATRYNTQIDRSVMLFALFGLSMPQFWLALNMIIVFSVNFGLFPSSGYRPLSSGIISNLKYLFMPALALGIGQSALIARMTRTTMLEVIREDYIKTARSKGLNEFFVIMKHALRNALVEIMTVIGMTLAALIGGAFVIETVFNIPGIGSLIINSVKRRDFPLIQGGILFVACGIVLVNLVVDIVYVYIDPRIRYTK